MTTDTRPICVNAMPNLRRNSTRLMVVMCIGIALSLYGVYIQTRSSSNLNYSPSVSVASSWLYHNVGQHLMSPSFLTNGGSCVRDRAPNRPTFAQLFMYRFVHPTMRYSAIVNGLINVSQILLLKVYCKSLSGTDTIIGLSAFGIGISLICLIGSFAFCRLMCISCLCIHHIVIIYLAVMRRRMVQGLTCPTSGPPNLFGPGSAIGGASAGCSGGISGPRGALGPRSGAGCGTTSSGPTANAAGKHGSTCKRAPDSNIPDPIRRRSNRT